MGPNTSEPGPILGLFQGGEFLGECRTLHRIHEAKTLPALGNGDLEVPTLKEFAGSPIEMVPAMWGSKFSICGSGQVSRFHGSRTVILCLSFGGGGGRGVHTRDGIVCNEFQRSMAAMTMRTRKERDSGGRVEFSKEEMWRRRREKGGFQ